MQYYEDVELNQPAESTAVTLSKEEIISFAKEWDPQPFHTDEEAAKQWPLGLTASGLHTIACACRLSNDIVEKKTAIVAGLGWDELRMPIPVCPGDSIRVRCFVAEKRESGSKPDMGIIRSKVEVLNQRDEIVLHFMISTLVMKRPENAS